jgi:hypothetical protein
MLLLIMNFSFTMRSPDSRVAVRQVSGHHRILVIRQAGKMRTLAWWLGQLPG